MPGPLRWHGAAFLKALKAEIRRRIARCCHVVADRARVLLNVEGAGRAIRAHSYWYGGRRRAVRKKGPVYGHSVSAPGEPPRKQTGRLLGSVAQEVGEALGTIRGRVGTNVKYGKALEQGAGAVRTSAWGKPTHPYPWILQPRPWLGRALKECRPALAAILGRRWTP